MEGSNMFFLFSRQGTPPTDVPCRGPCAYCGMWSFESQDRWGIRWISTMFFPWKLTTGYPKWWALEKLDNGNFWGVNLAILRTWPFWDSEKVTSSKVKWPPTIGDKKVTDWITWLTLGGGGLYLGRFWGLVLEHVCLWGLPPYGII